MYYMWYCRIAVLFDRETWLPSYCTLYPVVSYVLYTLKQHMKDKKQEQFERKSNLATRTCFFLTSRQWSLQTELVCTYLCLKVRNIYLYKTLMARSERRRKTEGSLSRKLSRLDHPPLVAFFFHFSQHSLPKKKAQYTQTDSY